MMKKQTIGIIISFFCLLALKGFAAQDPAVKNPSITPSPAIAGQTAEISFSIGNNGSTGIPGTSNAQRMSFTLGLSSGLSPTNPDGLSSLSGTITNYFDITYNAGNREYTGVQKLNVALPALTWSSVVIQATALEEPISAVVNIQPNAVANASSQPTANDFAEIDTPLPVTLTRFLATKEGDVTSLAWATTEESNSDYFEVQHSLNAKTWTALGTVKSHGESTVLRNYSFVHSAPSNGTNYYRLRMVDRDRTFAYSNIRNVTFQGLAGNTISVYPNPATDRLFVTNAEINKLKTLSIVGQDGKQLITGPVSTAGISIKSLQPGLYLVKLLGQDGTLSTHKLVVSE